MLSQGCRWLNPSICLDSLLLHLRSFCSAQAHSRRIRLRALAQANLGWTRVLLLLILALPLLRFCRECSGAGALEGLSCLPAAWEEARVGRVSGATLGPFEKAWGRR